MDLKVSNSIIEIQGQMLSLGSGKILYSVLKKL